jgi:hypothetical protein
MLKATTFGNRPNTYPGILPQSQALQVSSGRAGKVKPAIVDTGFQSPAGFQHARGERNRFVSLLPSPAQAELPFAGQSSLRLIPEVASKFNAPRPTTKAIGFLPFPMTPDEENDLGA